MPVMIIALCAVVCTFFVARFYAAKTRLVEKTIEDTIARKLSSAAPKVELDRLRDENGAMRNLLIDMVENEGTLGPAKSAVPLADQTEAVKARIQRRREIFGEAIYLLQQTEKARSRVAMTTSTHPHP